MERDAPSRPLAGASVGSRRHLLPAAGATHLPRRPAPEDQPTEDVIPMGEGRFQAMVMVASTLAGTAFLLHLISFRATTRVMDHWCRPPDAFANLSAAEWRSTAIPVEADGSRSRCTRFEPPDGGSRARVVPCDAWDFDTERYGNNAVSEWRLVCDRRWLVELALLVYVAACVLFLPLAGAAADRVGRRRVMHASLAALVAAGFATSLANSYLLFVALRIVVSAASNALCLVLYAVLYEVTTPARRDRYCFAAAAGASVAAPLSMLLLSRLRLGWEALHLALMAPTSALALAYCSVGSESPAWLVRAWNVREAETVALRAARINGAPLDECHAWFARETRRRDSEVPLLLFDQSQLAILAPDVRGSLVLLSCIWAATSFAFNQVSLNDMLPVKSALAAAGIVCMVPMYGAAYACCARFGARRSNVVAGLAFSALAVALAATHGHQLQRVSVALVVVLRMLGNLVFVLAFVVTVRQYPVAARCTGLCWGFALGRLSGSLGEVLFRLAPLHRRDIAVCVVAICMALAAVATEYLPVAGVLSASGRAEGAPGGAVPVAAYPSRRVSLATADERRRSMQDSLVPLPKGPHRERRRPRSSADDRLPEQYSVRVSGSMSLPSTSSVSRH
ncbi:solute carrier family 22 member 7-like isoform X1 [Dermacentor variabilis]|uniref:solute carrier family 22 member 7-like isoform X1 n=1 Tax=Dermacentor variabilis TaxID=34621 RepID=UPI003F5B2618